MRERRGSTLFDSFGAGGGRGTDARGGSWVALDGFRVQAFDERFGNLKIELISAILACCLLKLGVCRSG